MSSPASYADHTSDLYCTIYGNEPERQSDVYAQNNMELFEKVWFAGGATTTDKEQDGDKHTTTKTAAADPHEDDDGEDKVDEGERDVDEQAHVAKDRSAACIPLDWPEIPDQGPSSMQWTCDICDTQMSIFFRTEHLASQHPPKEKRPRRSRRKAESDTNTPMWHCELCDEQVNIFYTAEHTTGKKHVLKLKQSGEYQYTPASEQFIEHRAVYTPQDGEEVLAADDGEPEEYPPGEAYEEEEGAVYKPEKGEQGHDDWDPDGNAGGGEQLKGSAAYEGEGEEEEEEEEEYWEAEDMIIHRPLANEPGPLGFSGLESLKAPPPPPPPYPTQTSAAMGYPGQLSAGAKYMHAGQAAAGTEYPAQYQRQQPQPEPQTQTQTQPQPPPSQPRYQAFLSRLAGDKTQEPLSPQIAVHIQVPTFYCELCDTEYPISEQDEHPEDTKECTVCDDEYHVNQYPAHLASRDHRENAKAQGYAPPVPKVALPAPPPPPPAAVKVSRFHCELCDKTMGADSRASHLGGMKHKTKQQEFAATHAARKSNAPPRPTNPLVVVQARTESPKGFMGAFGVAKNFSCGLCKISMTVDVRDAHLASATHREREAAKAMERPDSPESAGAPAARGGLGSGWVRDADTARCEPCQRTIPANSWSSHTAGRKHIQNVEASKAAPTPLNVSNLARAMSSQASSPVTRRWDPTPGAGRPNGAASFPQTEYQVEKFHCKPCGISMHINDRETHIGGIKHGEAVASTSQGAPASQYSGASSSGGLPAPPPAQIPNYRCELCNMTMPLPDYHNHTYGKRHRTSVELANAQKQNDNAAPAVPTPPKVKVSLPKPGAAGKPSPRNIATEMVVTKVDGDLVVEVLKMEPDMRTGWCGICQEEVLRTTESHRSEAWKCDLCGITTHAAWKDLHMNTHDQRKPVSMFHRLGAYKML